MAEKKTAERNTTVRPSAFKVVLYEAIRDAALKQREALQDDDYDTFCSLLIQRETLLEKVEDIGPLPPTSATTNFEWQDRQAAASLVRDILSVDQETERLLSDRLELTRAEMVQMNQGSRALSGYAYLVPTTTPRSLLNQLS